MLLLHCVTAYIALCQLMQEKQPFSLAYEMVLLKKSLQPHVDFYLGEEQKLIARYGRQNEKGKPVFQEGQLLFVSETAALEYAENHRELDMVPVQWTAVSLERPVTIKPAQAEALMEVVQFTGGEKNGRTSENEASG